MTQRRHVGITSLALLVSLWMSRVTANKGGGELGDSTISEESRDGLFASLDGDGNGKITLDELTQFIEGTGGNSLDEQNEIQSAVTSTMNQLDHNKDNILKKDDLSLYWASLGSVLSKEEVSDWVAYSQLMPDTIVQKFIDNGITGYDFPELLENDGELLERELEITRQTIKKRLMRGMKMRLLGMGSPPPVAKPPIVLSTELTVCYTKISMEWNAVTLQEDDHNDIYPVHLYRLQRQESDVILPHLTNNVHSIGMSTRWVTVYEGTETSCLDKVFTPPLKSLESVESGSSQIISISYRLSSWNVIGRSEYSYLKLELTPPSSSLPNDDCVDPSSNRVPSYLSPTELELMSLLSQKSPRTANVSPESTLSVLKLGEQARLLQSDSSIPTNTAPDPVLAGFFPSLFDLFYQSIIWSLTTGIPALMYFLFSTRRLPNPNGMVDHPWVTRVIKVFSSLSSWFIWGCRYWSVKVPVLKAPLEGFIYQLESVNSPQPVPLPPNQTMREQRPLKRGNSLRSEESADSNNSEGKTGDKECCFLCGREFEKSIRKFKIVLVLKHHCHQCKRDFCSKCGVVTHLNPQCPVRGTCCCKLCHEKKHNLSGDSPKGNQEKVEDVDDSPCAMTTESLDQTQAAPDPVSFRSQLKKHKSFGALKDLSLGMTTKSERVSPPSVCDPSDLPPRPPSQKKRGKFDWIPRPTLGKRVISSPPLSLSSQVPPPPDISHASSWSHESESGSIS